MTTDNLTADQRAEFLEALKHGRSIALMMFENQARRIAELERQLQFAGGAIAAGNRARESTETSDGPDPIQFAQAREIIAQYAAGHPKMLMFGVWQDPLGAHAWLERNKIGARPSQPTRDIYCSCESECAQENGQKWEPLIKCKRVEKPTEAADPLRINYWRNQCNGLERLLGEANAKIDELEELEHPGLSVNIAPIAKIIVRDDKIESASMYAPGLPDGEHDLFPVPVDSRGEWKPMWESEPPNYCRWDDDGCYTFTTGCGNQFTFNEDLKTEVPPFCMFCGKRTQLNT
jgi:hypothetical protein